MSNEPRKSQFMHEFGMNYETRSARSSALLGDFLVGKTRRERVVTRRILHTTFLSEPRLTNAVSNLHPLEFSVFGSFQTEIPFIDVALHYVQSIWKCFAKVTHEKARAYTERVCFLRNW